MAELATIARPYAQALYQVAQSGSTGLASWSAFISEVAAVAANPEMEALSHNPNVSGQQLADLLLAAVKSPASDEGRKFVAMLAENGRVTLLPEISRQFHALKNAQEGVANAEIVSAFPLSNAQRDDLVATLEKRFGRKLTPSVTVEPSLIGGVRVVVGDEVLDTSVRAKLQQMHVALTA